MVRELNFILFSTFLGRFDNFIRFIIAYLIRFAMVLDIKIYISLFLNKIFHFIE